MANNSGNEEYEELARRHMDAEDFYFADIKEKRSDYMAEYQPPRRPTFSFAILQLTFLGAKTEVEITTTLEAESTLWLRRFPIPLMASAFDDKGNSIHLSGKEHGSVVGWIADDQPKLSWEISTLDRHVQEHPLPKDLRHIYEGVPYKTKDTRIAERVAWIKKQRVQVTATKTLLYIWLIVIPLIVAILEFNAPEWVAVLVLAYAFFKAWQEWRKLTGRSQPSKLEQEKAEIERRKEHYFYHCERNPEGFSRLLVENFDRESRERILQEVASLDAPKASLASSAEPPVKKRRKSLLLRIAEVFKRDSD